MKSFVRVYGSIEKIKGSKEFKYLSIGYNLILLLRKGQLPLKKIKRVNEVFTLLFISIVVQCLRKVS